MSNMAASAGQMASFTSAIKTDRAVLTQQPRAADAGASALQQSLRLPASSSRRR